MKKVLKVMVFLAFVALFSVSAQAQQKYTVNELQQLLETMESNKLSIDSVIDLIQMSNNITSQKTINADEIKLIVDYTKSVEQAIAEGSYDRRHYGISVESFPISSKVYGKKFEVSARLFHFDRDIMSKEVITEMDKVGFRPGTLMDLLALGTQYSEMQRTFPIAAVGSVWRYGLLIRCVPCLKVEGSSRELSLDYFVNNWDARWHFLGVPK